MGDPVVQGDRVSAFRGEQPLVAHGNVAELGSQPAGGVSDGPSQPAREQLRPPHVAGPQLSPALQRLGQRLGPLGLRAACQPLQPRAQVGLDVEPAVNGPVGQIADEGRCVLAEVVGQAEEPGGGDGREEPDGASGGEAGGGVAAGVEIADAGDLGRERVVAADEGRLKPFNQGTADGDGVPAGRGPHPPRSGQLHDRQAKQRGVVAEGLDAPHVPAPLIRLEPRAVGGKHFRATRGRAGLHKREDLLTRGKQGGGFSRGDPVDVGGGVVVAGDGNAAAEVGEGANVGETVVVTIRRLSPLAEDAGEHLALNASGRLALLEKAVDPAPVQQGQDPPAGHRVGDRVSKAVVSHGWASCEEWVSRPPGTTPFARAARAVARLEHGIPPCWNRRSVVVP